MGVGIPFQLPKRKDRTPLGPRIERGFIYLSGLACLDGPCVQCFGMRRLHLAANVPVFQVALDLATSIRLFDKEAIISIREGKGIDGAWRFTCMFDLAENAIRFSDVKLMFKNSVEASGGKLLSA